MKIITYPNPILRTTAESVTDFDGNLKKLVISMAEAMAAHQGIGLAANQVGAPGRVIIVEIHRQRVQARARRSGTDYSKLVDQKVPLTAFINPEIVHYSRKTVVATEGCLSLPGLEVDVERSLAVKVRARNLKGKKIMVAAKGLFARVLQHEVDHLNGVLIIDHGRPKKVKPDNEL